MKFKKGDIIVSIDGEHNEEYRVTAIHGYENNYELYYGKLNIALGKHSISFIDKYYKKKDDENYQYQDIDFGTKKRKCTCGAHAVKSHIHSEWCDLGTKEEKEKLEKE